MLEIPAWLRREHVSSVAEHCNGRKLNAKKAGDQSALVFLCHFINTRFIARNVPFLDTAVVVDIGDKTFDVFVPRSARGAKHCLPKFLCV